ncbi:MAG: type II toxin-antitoxin system RelE/ParE family toxin [Thermoanaerobaculia bacterium]
MWNDRLRLAATIEADWAALSPHERDLATAALERIDDDPIAGVPLFEPLRGLWSFRAEHLRIVYELVAEARYVAVLSIARAGDAW